MPSSVNIDECSLEDLVRKGTVNDIIKKLELTPVSLDDESYYDYYLLIAALSKGQTKVADFLISNGFRVYKKVKAQGEKTPLHYATEISNYHLTQMLLLNGATLDIATVDENGRTPLDVAINREDSKIISLIISNAKNTVLDDMFLYHYAVQHHDFKLVQLLLKKGLLPTRKNNYNETPFCLAVKEGHEDILCLLWKSFDLIMNSNPDHITCLGLVFVAIIVDDKESVSELLESEFDSSTNVTIKPCEEGWALFDYFDGFSLLHCAVKYVQPNIVSFLLDNFASVEIQDATGSSPLHIALEIKEEIADKNNGRYRVNEEIIDSIICATEKEYLNLVNKHGISHFHVMCTENNERAITHYILNGASISDSVHLDSPIYKGFAPLHFATKYMCRKTIKVLLDQGADLEQEAYYKMSALHIAAKESSLQTVKLLIKHGADITKQDCDGNTPVHYAFQAKNYEILDFLLTVHAIINANPVNSAGISHFHIACTRDDLSIVAGFLRNGASVNDCVPLDPNIRYSHHNDDIDWRGCSPLHFAAAFNRMEIVKFLLEQNADVGICDARGFTPFHIACQYTYEKFGTLIEDYLRGMLIFEEMDRDYEYDDNFIDVTEMETELKLYQPHDFYDLCDDDDESKIVDWSSNRKDQINIVELLIEYNSDVNKIDKFGNAPLFYICYFNLKKILTTMSHNIRCKSIIRMLLLKSLMNEMCYRRRILLNCLLKRKVNMEQCYKNGSILHFISIDREYSDIGRLEIMNILLNLGADVNAVNEKKKTPLHLATYKKDVKAVEILLDYNADVNCTEAQNSATPLHIATNLFCIEIIDLLLMKEADINVKQSNGKTPLHILLTKRYHCYSEFKPIFHHYVSSGADVNVPDQQGKTPLHVACETMAPEVVDDLLMFGADMTAADRNGETIYQCVYRQLKSIITAFHKLEDNLFEISWTLYNHALKLFTIGLISEKVHKEISQKFFQLKELSNHSRSSYQNQELNNLVSKCYLEIDIFRNTEIYNDISMFDLLFEEDYEMIKYINNSNLKAVIESDSFDETYCCYGYLLKLRFNRGLERSELLPKAKECLTYLTNARLTDCFSDNIFMHLNNSEMREFIRVVSLVKCDKQISADPTPLKIIKDCSKYSRIA